ncbi:hypothetical protein J6590_050657 [Homalodisca vitripennis]|nr:hypothetical protein J6590_050657 [Homalodisca vitripennis]
MIRNKGGQREHRIVDEEREYRTKGVQHEHRAVGDGCYMAAGAHLCEQWLTDRPKVTGSLALKLLSNHG